MSDKFIGIEQRDVISREEFAALVGELDEKVRAKESSEPIPIGELKSRVERNVLTPPNSPKPDCLTCGLCCSSLLTVHVHREDSAPREKYWEVNIKARKREIIVDRVLKRDSENGRCMSLNGEIGKQIACDIYEDRPNLCRAFEAGSDKCHALRRINGLEPKLQDHETANALMALLTLEDSAKENGLIYHAEISETEIDEVFQISVIVGNEAAEVLHKFNANDEEWIESDFIGLKMKEADELISSNK